ncbi:MAG: trehalose-6-phosphate synthase [Acidobacteriota bacterium]|nr:trehalose-6-phosphate synthase [Acidobacteriota bacterium]
MLESDSLGDPARLRPLAVVSNREPYLHTLGVDGGVTWSPTTGGVSVALDALMRERGGVWIAHGVGDADRLAVDEHDRVWVPPDAPTYQLKRIWLTESEERHYYEGFANEGLWPLCHVAHVKPVFRAEDWRVYQDVNRRFAQTVDRELSDTAAPVFIQDYHLTLVPRFLRERRSDIRVALFWHIPFPHPDQLRICPYRRQILEGLVDCDLLAFQLERDRRNFLGAVSTELGAKVSRSRVRVQDRTTTVCAIPIGVDFDRIQGVTRSSSFAAEQSRLRRELRIDTPLVGVGVDRLDYTKGIPERLSALDVLLTRWPGLNRQLTFVQIAVPSRSKLDSYAAVEADIDQRVAAINKKHARPGSGVGPIRYRKAVLRMRRLTALYGLADFCIVSSLHDGMNLVAKEFVAAREDLNGVLVLSELAGAAQELGDAVIINPYDVEGFADGLQTALDMPDDERHRRMRALRRVVAGRDVFRWASDILEGLDKVDPRARLRPPDRTRAR